METNNIFDGAYSRIIEDEAWQRVSGDYPFSAEQLEQYKDRLDWHEVSGNRNISWTASMLEKFKRRLDWHELFYPFLKYIFLNIQNNEKPCNFVPGKWESNR